MQPQVVDVVVDETVNKLIEVEDSFEKKEELIDRP